MEADAFPVITSGVSCDEIFNDDVTAVCGCGPSEPTLAEVELGMKERFILQSGNFAVRLISNVKKIGDARWSVWLTMEQNGDRRTLSFA